MTHFIHSHLTRIRNADDHVKKWWIGGATAVVMILILFLWLLFLNTSIPKLESPQSATSSVPIVQEDTSPSFFKTIAQGFTASVQKVGNSFSSLAHLFEQGFNSAKEINTTQKTNTTNEEKNVPFSPHPTEEEEKIELPVK